MNRRGKPQHGCPDSVCRERKRRVFRLAGKVGIVCILFCCERALALREQGPGGDDQRTIRARERAAECFDRMPIRLGGWPIICEIMDKSSVDHSIGSRCAAAKAGQVLQITAMYFGPRRDKRFGSRIRAGETEHLIACLDKFLNNCGPDEPCGASYENTHSFSSYAVANSVVKDKALTRLASHNEALAVSVCHSWGELGRSLVASN